MTEVLNKMQAIDYAKAACDTMMRKFEAEELPPVGHFHYHQGVFLSESLGGFLCKTGRNHSRVRSRWKRGTWMLLRRDMKLL